MIGYQHFDSGFSGLGASNVPISTTTEATIAGGLTTAAIATGGPTNPVGLALTIAAGVSNLLAAAGIGSGCGQTCIASTNIVNQAEPILKQNIALWNSEPHTLANQQQAINVFNQVWSSVVAGCSSPSLGNAGHNCIADRQRGGKWDWFSYYLDPIANATDISDPAGTITGDASLLAGSLGLGGNSGLLILGAGILLVGVMLTK